MRNRLDERYRSETGLVYLDRNTNNPQFGVVGHVGGMVLRKIIVDNYAPPICDFLLTVMTRAEKRVGRVFQEGDRVVVSDGRVLKFHSSEPALVDVLNDKGFVANEIRLIDRRFSIDLAQKLSCDNRRHAGIVAPNLIRRMRYDLKLGYVHSGVQLWINGERSAISGLDIIARNLAVGVQKDFAKLPASVRRPFKTEEVVMQSLYDSILFQKEEAPDPIEEAGEWSVLEFLKGVLAQNIPLRGLDMV